MRDDRLLRISEAAERLGLRESTLRRWVLLRKITFTKPGGRAVRIPISEVERLILQSTVPARERA